MPPPSGSSPGGRPAGPTRRFLIFAAVVADTIGAIAADGGRTFTWLVVLLVTFLVPSAAPIAAVIAVTTAHHLATRIRR